MHLLQSSAQCTGFLLVGKPRDADAVTLSVVACLRQDECRPVRNDMRRLIRVVEVMLIDTAGNGQRMRVASV